MGKIFAVITVARQIQGEYVFIRTEKGFEQASKADELLNIKKSQFAGPDGKPMPIKITTPHGEAECLCEVGVFEIETE
jgi:3-deoxy-D-manno-octulosonic acid (KDO) 8-phosphate synthase